MGTGYARKDTTNNIANGNVINASDLDAEFDGVEAAFDESTGHDHGGGADNGAPITKVGPAQDVVVSISAVTPKTDNTLDLGSSTLEFKDLWIDGTANIDSLVADTADINGGSVDGVTIGTNSVVTDLRVDNIQVNGNTISSTDTNGNVVIAPNGTGDVQLDADTVRVGDSNANATVTTNGTGDLILNTNAGTNSGSITIEDGVNGNIIIAPNGAGQVQITNASLDLTSIEVTNIKAKDGTAAATIADSTGKITVSTELAVDNLNLSGNTISSTDTNGNIVIAPNGNGQVQITNASLDLTSIEVTNIKAKDGTAAATIADSTGKITVSTELAVDNINLSGNIISSTNTNGNIALTPNGSGEVDISKVDIDSGTIDGTTIGGTTPAAGNFTTVDATDLEVTNLKAKDGTAAGSIANTTGVVTLNSAVLTTADINGGTIDGATIATSNITVGSGKTLNVSDGTLTLANDQISGDKIQGGTIGSIQINELTIGTFIQGLSGETSSLANGASETIIASVVNYSTYIIWGGGTDNTSALGIALAQTNGGGTTTVTQLSGAPTGISFTASTNNIRITNNTAQQAYAWRAIRLVNWR